MTDNKETNRESFKVSGEDLMDKVKQIIKEGNARKIIIKNEKGDVIMEFPLTIGAVGILLAPVFAAVGAIAALVTDCEIIVEKRAGKRRKLIAIPVPDLFSLVVERFIRILRYGRCYNRLFLYEFQEGAATAASSCVSFPLNASWGRLSTLNVGFDSPAFNKPFAIRMSKHPFQLLWQFRYPQVCCLMRARSLLPMS